MKGLFACIFAVLFLSSVVEASHFGLGSITGFAVADSDLEVVDVKFSSADPTKSGVTVVTATVRNSGFVPSSASSVLIDLGLRRPWTFNVPVLAPGASMSFQVTPWLAVGSHSFAVYADSENQVSESNKLNNQVVDSLYIGKPSLALAEGSTSVTPSRLPFFTSPDLVVSDIIFSPEQPVTGDVVGANITVQNIGSAASDPSVLYVSGTRSGTWKLPVGALDPGESVVVNIPQLRPWFSLGVYTFTARADVNGQVSEVDERNNVLQKTLIVSLPVLGVSATAVSDKGNLTVLSDPSGARVYVDNIFKGVTPVTVSGLSAGRHVVNLTKDLFFGYNTTVNIDISSPLALSASLDSVRVDMIVSSVPSGASVYLDGVLEGVAPVTIPVRYGTYSLRLTKKYYQDRLYEVVNDLSSDPLNVNLEMVPKVITLSVSSVPSGASVFVDGVNKGVSPVSASVNAGVHSVRVSKKYYNDYNNANVDLDADTSLPVTMTNKVVTLSASSSPSGATLFVDGVNKGVTPVSASVNAGVHSVRVSKAKYYDYTTTLDMDGPASVSPTLSLKPGILSVNSVPEGATVYVNNVNRGTTPVSISMSQGSYTVKLTKTNYGDISNSVIINADATTTANWNLPMLNRKMYLYSNPSGANFVVTAYDLRATGVTPGVIDMKCTYQHSVTMSKDGYFDATQSGIYTDSTCAPISISLTLVPASPTPSASTGTLSVTSTPVSGSVSIDNVNKGTTPVSLTLNQGTYTVKVTNSGYQDYSTSASVAAGRTTTVSATLPTRANMLYVYSNPSGASVSFRYYETSYGWHTVNAGMSPAAIQLYAGWSSMSVTLSKAGYKSATYSEGSSGWNSYRNQYGQYTYEVNVNLVPN